MDKLNAMACIVKVVALGSYAEAARALGLTRSAISKAVLELEQEMGVRLLDRTTRRVSPTEAGLAYYHRCVDILARVEETELQVSKLHGEPRGVLKINAPVSFGVLHLAPAVAELMARHRDLKIELTLNDRFIDPLEEGVDVTVRIGHLADSSLIARKLAPAHRVVVAAPDYLARHGAPATPAELSLHRCLAYGHATALQRWQFLENGEPALLPINAVMCSNNGDVLRAAALAGEGITLLPTFLVGPDIADGRLVIVLADWPPTALDIFALYTPNRFLAAKTRVLIDFLHARFGEAPMWDAFRRPIAGQRP